VVPPTQTFGLLLTPLLQCESASTQKHRTETSEFEVFVSWISVSVGGPKTPRVSTTTFGKISTAPGLSDATSARATLAAKTAITAPAAPKRITRRVFPIIVLITSSPFLTASCLLREVTRDDDVVSYATVESIPFDVEIECGSRPQTNRVTVSARFFGDADHSAVTRIG